MLFESENLQSKIKTQQSFLLRSNQCHFLDDLLTLASLRMLKGMVTAGVDIYKNEANIAPQSHCYNQR